MLKRRVSVLLLSDTHGCLDPRLAELVRCCDFAVHAGDIGGLEVLAGLQPRIETRVVRGNNDMPGQWPERECEALAMIPWENQLELPGGTLVITHGHRTMPAYDRHALLRQRYPEARAVVYGHSHRLVVDTESLPWVLNPGAAGRARTHGGPSCLRLVAEAMEWKVEVHRFPPAAGRRPGR